MGQSKWLLVCFTLALCTLAAGIGIGWVLPHGEKNHGDSGQPRSEFFQRLAAETAPDKNGSTREGVLAARLRKKFTVQVIRSTPETMVGSGGPYANGDPLNFTAVIMSRSGGGIDGQALLLEIEDYLKELAGAKASEGVKTKTENRGIDNKEVTVQWVRYGKNEISIYDDHKIDGKRAGFVFRYQEPGKNAGEIKVDLYGERKTTLGGIWGLVSVSMDVRE